MLTSDRHGGLSGEPWPDRIINYDGEFVRFRSIIPGSEVHGEKKRKRKKETPRAEIALYRRCVVASR